jgi:hypothetical protein
LSELKHEGARSLKAWEAVKLRTAQKRGISVEIPSERFQKITRLFRAVDCANPVIDFRGRVLLGKDPALTKSLGLESKKIVETLSVNVVQGSQDGPSNINEDLSLFSSQRGF